MSGLGYSELGYDDSDRPQKFARYPPNFQENRDYLDLYWIFLVCETSCDYMNEASDLKIIAESLRRVRTGLAWFTGGCIIVAAVTAGVGIAQQKLTPMLIGFGGAAAGAGALSLGFLLHYARIQSVPIYRLLRDTPENIVWFYDGSTFNRVNGIHVSTECWVCIHLRNGKSLQLRSVHPAYVEEILKTIQHRAPQAVSGYSKEIARQYLQDPTSLL